MAVFHLSFWVDDLERAKAFYVRTLGCTLGRERASWFDVDFFGHQLTIHQSRTTQPHLDGVGDSGRALDHFGVIVSMAEWTELAQRLQNTDVTFRIRPLQNDVGLQSESGKLVITDPEGVGLEFKYYVDIAAALQRDGDG